MAGGPRGGDHERRALIYRSRIAQGDLLGTFEHNMRLHPRKESRHLEVGVPDIERQQGVTRIPDTFDQAGRGWVGGNAGGDETWGHSCYRSPTLRAITPEQILRWIGSSKEGSRTSSTRPAPASRRSRS